MYIPTFMLYGRMAMEGNRLNRNFISATKKVMFISCQKTWIMKWHILCFWNNARCADTDGTPDYRRSLLDLLTRRVAPGYPNRRNLVYGVRFVIKLNTLRSFRMHFAND